MSGPVPDGEGTLETEAYVAGIKSRFTGCIDKVTIDVK